MTAPTIPRDQLREQINTLEAIESLMGAADAGWIPIGAARRELAK